MLQSLGQNTTIGCILTNAKLTKCEANKLADIAHDGYAMTIKPALAPISRATQKRA